MSLPGPSGVVWAGELLLWAASAAVLGEAVRRLSARWVPSWRHPFPVERFLLAFYLGGATMYLLAALPVGAFLWPVTVGAPVLATAFVLVERARPS